MCRKPFFVTNVIVGVAILRRMVRTNLMGEQYFVFGKLHMLCFQQFFQMAFVNSFMYKMFPNTLTWVSVFFVYWIILFSTTVQRTISNKRGTLFIYSSQFIQFNVRERILKERDVCILKAQRLQYEYKFRSYVVLWSFVMHHLLSYYQGMYHFISSLE